MQNPNATLARLDAQSMAGTITRRPRPNYDPTDYGVPRDGQPTVELFRWHTIIRLWKRAKGGGDTTNYYQVWNNAGAATVPLASREAAVAWIDETEGGPVDAAMLAKIAECRASMEAARRAS